MSVNASKRGVRGAIVAALIVAQLVQIIPVPVYAHDGEDHDDTAHAAQDLAGTSITEIEKKTAENKRAITKSTGIEPGSARGAGLSAAAVSADPGVSGSWSSVINTEVVPIFQAVLPNGKVLMWDSVGDNASETYPTHNFTRAMVWNPANNTYKRVDVQGYNIFCAGFAHLQNGNILVAGGNKDASLAGIVQTHIFNWQTETWSRGANMAAGRWYPSVTTMANGELAIIGGGPATMEVYRDNNTVRTATGFTNAAYGGRLYPFMISRPDTLLQLLGPYDTMYTVATPGLGMTVGTKARDSRYRHYGSFATYDIGKTLIVGGGSVNEDGLTSVPTRSNVIANTNTGLTPVISQAAWLAVGQGRRQHNATVLADGTVLVTGGMISTAESTLVDLNRASTSALLWKPTTNTWTTLASAARIREYHSTAALLPDGRVLTGGGGVCGECMTKGYLEKNLEYFTPPYLYKKDGSGQLASRPVISTAPATVNINTNFAVSSPQTATISKVALVGLADVTHSVDQGQKYIPLKFTKSGTTLTVTGPATGGIAPPGYYMLFITDTNGVPSVAKIIKVAMQPRPLLTGVRNSGAARCIDVPGSSIAIKTYIQMYACNGTRAQAMTRLLTDSSIRVLGNCLDVPSSRFVSGQKIWTYACNNTNAQKWQFRTDGTIRPIAKQTLCLTAASAADRAAVTISTCSTTNTRQKWTW